MRYPAALLLFVIAGGCVSPPPTNYPEIDLQIPHVWQGAPVDSQGVALHWWTSFRSPELDAIIVEALDRNYDLQAAAARLEVAAAQARIAGADLWPHINAGLDAARQRRNFIGFPFSEGGFDEEDGGSSPQEEVFHTTFNSYGLSMNLSWEIDLWGRLRAGKQAALADYQAAEAQLNGAFLSLTAQTAKAWFATVESRAQIKLAQDTVESFGATAKLVADRVDAGVSPSLDSSLAESDLAEAQALLENRRVIHERLRRQLEILLGHYPGADRIVAGDLPALPDPVPAGLPSELLRRRHDIVVAERRLAATDARVAQAQASLYPRLSLTSGAGTASEEFDDLLTSDFFVWTLAGNLTRPLFEGERLVAQVDVAQGRAKEAQADYANTLLQAFAEVETALATEELLAQKEQRLLRAVEQATQASTLSSDRYQQGVQDLITVLESQRRALVREIQLIAVRRERLDTRIDLHLALGGGFDAQEYAHARAISTEPARASSP